MLALIACASPGVPPGAPERHVPPMITRIQPDTNSVGVRGKEFVVHFDEVISERPANAASLKDLVIISPRSGAVDVDWHRSSISLRPAKGWKRNTTYTVSLLPGISDLRGNVRSTPTVVTFSTGPSIENTVLGGTLFDWLSGLPVTNGMVEAHTLTDTSTVYLASSDSLGHYSMRGLPVAMYAVRGYTDGNRNHAYDAGEAFDTTGVYLKDTLNLELLAFAHDSTGPKLTMVSASDSVSIHATFDTPLDPRIPLATSGFTLTGPDSAQIAIASVSVVRPDTARAAPAPSPAQVSAIPIPQRRPAQPALVLPKPTRPLLVRDLRIVVATPLRAGATYRLTAINATGPTGKKLSSDKTFEVPKTPPPADSAAQKKPVPSTPNRQIRPVRPAR